MEKLKLKIFALVFVLCYLFYSVGYIRGENKGMNVMFNATMDTVNTILKKQMKSDTSSTFLKLMGRDTNTYVISRKTVIVRL